MRDDRLSTVELIGLTDRAWEILLLLAICLTLSPWLGAVNFGTFQIPAFPNSTAQLLKIWGPVGLVVVLFVRIPIWPRRTSSREQKTGEADKKAPPGLSNGHGLVQTPKIGKLPPPLTEAEERKFLAEFTEWKILECEEPSVPLKCRRELYRVYEFMDFKTAFDFMCYVSKNKIRNHHPRWQNTYNRVEVWLCTFNIGHQISKKDSRLAQDFEEAWLEFKKTTDRDLWL